MLTLHSGGDIPLHVRMGSFSTYLQVNWLALYADKYMGTFSLNGYTLDNTTMDYSSTYLVGLRGSDPGLELFALINKILTAGPFGNNFHRIGYSLTRCSIGGCQNQVSTPRDCVCYVTSSGKRQKRQINTLEIICFKGATYFTLHK